MTRTVIAVAALALAARASATNGPKPEKALGKKGCDICSGGTVNAHAHAGGFCDRRDIAIESGYHDITGSYDMPDLHPEMAHLGNPECPAYEVVLEAWYDCSSTSRRDYDARKDKIKEKLKENDNYWLKKIFIARMPYLKEPQFKKVLDHLVANCQLDHILTASAPAP